MSKPSTQFSNGSEYEFFHGSFCERCTKHKTSPSGDILPDNCKIEQIISVDARFDLSRYKEIENDIVQIGDMFHICLHFHSDDETIMSQYSELIKEESPCQT